MANHDEIIDLLSRVDERLKALAERQEEACHRLRRIDEILQDHAVRIVLLERAHAGHRWRWKQAGVFVLELVLAVASAYLMMKFGLVKP